MQESRDFTSKWAEMENSLANYHTLQHVLLTMQESRDFTSKWAEMENSLANYHTLQHVLLLKRLYLQH